MSLLARLQSYFNAVNAPQGRPAPVVALLLPDDYARFASAALATPGRAPLLACTADQLRLPPAVPGLRFILVAGDAPVADIQVNMDANAQGFDPAAPQTTLAEAEAFRPELERGRALTAMLGTAPVAAGMVTAPVAGIAELAGITTLAAYRGRGIAAALTAELARVAFGLGVDTAILSTDNPVAYRVYVRIGFAPVAALIPADPAG